MFLAAAFASALQRGAGRMSDDAVLRVPTRFNRAETWGIMLMLLSVGGGAAYVNLELGGIKERGVAMRSDIAELKRDRDRVTRLEEQNRQIIEMLRELREDLRRLYKRD